MKKLIISSILLSSLAATAFAAAKGPDLTTPAAKLIQAQLHGQADITNSFPVGKNLTGFVVEAAQGGQSTILYASNDGQYLFAGNLVSADGKNLTQAFTQQYIDSKTAGKIAASLSQLAYFTEGSDKAAHKMYVFFDPNCSACNYFYKELRPAVAKGEVQIRWIPVAFRTPDSAGKGVAILTAGNDAASAKLMAQDEDKFDMQKESGGLTAATKSKANQKFFDQVEKNTKLFFASGANATPTSYYKDTSGQAQVLVGAVPPQQLETFLAKVGGKW